MQRKIQFKSNLDASMVSFTTHESREYMVAPCVALVPGVLNGDLVTLEAVEKTFRAWNGVPVVLDHPFDDNGMAISANDPTILSRVGMGQSFHADVENERLRVEVWLDLDKCKTIGSDAQKIVDNIREGKAVEVSTGYWATLKTKSGEHNGEKYSAVTEWIIPDHLAMLPNSLGACSWADGCGVPRFMEDNQAILPGMFAQMTMHDKMMSLATIISSEMDAEGVDSWRWHIIDIEDDFAIVAFDNKVMRRQFSQADNGTMAMMGEWQDVERQTTYAPIAANNAMCKCGGMALQELEEVEVEDESSTDDEIIEEDDMATQSDQEQVTTNEGTEAVDTLQTFLAKHEVTESEILEALEHRSARKATLVEQISTNSQMTDADLSGIPIATLEKMAASLTANIELVVETNTPQDQDTTVYPRGLPAEPTRQREGKGFVARRSVMKKERAAK